MNIPWLIIIGTENKRRGSILPQFLKSLNARMFDLMAIFVFKNKIYPHSDFKGSASLKVVLPVLCPELSYESPAIHGGNVASASWPVLTDKKTPANEREELEKNMLAYCERDTEAMVGILKHLYKQIA